MSKAEDFLVEIGTEELPPKALRSLMDAFGEKLADGIDSVRLSRGEIHCFASPRRIAVLVKDLAKQQLDQKVEQKGPPVKVAFDGDGKATPSRCFCQKVWCRRCRSRQKQNG